MSEVQMRVNYKHESTVQNYLFEAYLFCIDKFRKLLWYGGRGT